jgi:hypothetical protein
VIKFERLMILPRHRSATAAGSAVSQRYDTSRIPEPSWANTRAGDPRHSRTMKRSAMRLDSLREVRSSAASIGESC